MEKLKRFSSVQKLAAIALCIACQFTPDPVNPPPPPPTDSCDLACKNMKKLGCDGWEGSPGYDEIFGTDDDVSCFRVCVETMDADPSVDIHPGCVSEAESCKEVEECFED